MVASIHESRGNGERITTLAELVPFEAPPKARRDGHRFRAPVTRHCPGSDPRAVAPEIVVELSGHRTYVSVAFDDADGNARIEPGVDAILLDPRACEKVGPVVLGDGLDPQAVCDEALRLLQGSGRRG